MNNRPCDSPPSPRPPAPYRLRHGLSRCALLILCATGLATAAEPAVHDEIDRLLRDGQHAEALARTDAALRRDPADLQTQLLRGVALIELGRLDEARKHFEALTRQHPRQPEPWNNLAVVHARQGRLDAARDMLERALRTHPSYAVAHDNLGDVYAGLASQAYDKALQLNAPAAGSPGDRLAVLRLLGGANAPVTTLAQAGPRDGGPATSRPQPGPHPEPARVVVNMAPPALPPPVKTEKLPEPPGRHHTEAPHSPPAAIPVPPAAVAAPASEQARKDALAAAERWAEAWSRRDVAAYLAAYDRDFVVPSGRSRSAWEDERRARIQKPSRIEVKLLNARATVDGDTARIVFVQQYRASNFSADTPKTLELVRRENGWRIRRELVGS